MAATSKTFDSFAEGQLLWLPELGIGWFPVISFPYDSSYWERYKRLDETPTGEALTRLRRDLVSRYQVGRLVDVGIGGGRFVSESGAKGFDVNPNAVQWLKATGNWLDPHLEDFDSACFWDSLEHIPEPMFLLSRVRRYVFVSLPIFQGCDDVLKSKHFRKDEHCFYFTASGLERFMDGHSFDLIERNEMEQSVGREQIETFAFKRRCAA